MCLVASSPGVASNRPPSSEASSPSADATDSRSKEVLPFGFDVLPMVGTSSARPHAVRRISLNLIGGVSGGTWLLELGSVLNVTLGEVRGVQLSGVGNVTLDRIDGLQGAGALNLAGGDVEGAQLAGAANLTGGDIEGWQAAAAFNLAGGRIDGLQTGVVNVTLGKVDGLQLGVVNVAEQSTASIGLINVIFGGFVDLELSGSIDGLLTTSLRHGGQNTFNTYHAGLYPSSEGLLPVFGLGFGWRHVWMSEWEVSVDVTAFQIQQRVLGDSGSFNVVTKLRPLVGWRPSEYIALSGGPTLNVQTFDADTPTGSIAPYDVWTGTLGSETSFVTWPGLTLEVRFL